MNSPAHMLRPAPGRFVGWAVPTRSDAELLLDQPGHLGTVGAPARLAHDVAHYGTDGLGVAGPHALSRLGVGLDRRRDYGSQRLSRVATEAAQPLGLDDLRRVAALGHQVVQHLTR